jgi:outer membrane protein assembly factor BamD (BamD/ComL family)
MRESAGSWNLYRSAMDAYEAGDYEGAHAKFWELAYEWDCGECEEKVRESAYHWAIDLYVDGRY